MIKKISLVALLVASSMAKGGGNPPNKKYISPDAQETTLHQPKKTTNHEPADKDAHFKTDATHDATPTSMANSADSQGGPPPVPLGGGPPGGTTGGPPGESKTDSTPTQQCDGYPIFDEKIKCGGTILGSDVSKIKSSCVKKCSTQIGCSKQHRVTSDLGQKCQDVINPCCNPCIQLLDNLDCTNMDELLNELVTNNFMSSNNDNNDGKMNNMFQLDYKFKDAKTNPSDSIDKIDDEMLKGNRVSETLDAFRNSTYMKSKSKKERDLEMRTNYDALKEKTLHALKASSFDDYAGQMVLDKVADKLNIADVESLIGFSRLGEVKDLPKIVVEKMSPTGFNDAPNGFFKRMKQKSMMRHIKVAVIRNMNPKKRKEIRSNDLISFARDQDREKTVALLCGGDDSKPCAVREALAQGKKAKILDFKFSETMTAFDKSVEYIEIGTKVNSLKSRGILADVSILEKVQEAIDDAESDDSKQRLLRSMGRNLLQTAPSPSPTNADAVDFEDVAGFRIQTDGNDEDLKNVADTNDQAKYSGEPTVTEIDGTTDNTNDDTTKATCNTSSDCPNDAGVDCGYHCLDKKCAMWCNSATPPSTGGTFCGIGTIWNVHSQQCTATYDGIMQACKDERKEWGFTCETLVTCDASPSPSPSPSSDAESK